jgi:hypothetical protein
MPWFCSADTTSHFLSFLNFECLRNCLPLNSPTRRTIFGFLPQHLSSSKPLSMREFCAFTFLDILTYPKPDSLGNLVRVFSNPIWPQVLFVEAREDVESYKRLQYLWFRSGKNLAYNQLSNRIFDHEFVSVFRKEARVLPPLTIANGCLCLATGSWCDAQDDGGHWYVSKIVAVRGLEVLIHFMCWSWDYDEWIPVPSSRITPLYDHRSRLPESLLSWPFRASSLD